jgi:hypothetical protein
MFSKKYDLLFIFSIIFITIFGLFLLNDFLNKKELNIYLDVLKNSIAEMIPESERSEFERIYYEFVEDVDDNKVQAPQLKELAIKIAELRQEKESLSPQELKNILTVTRDIPEIISPALQINPAEWKKWAGEFEQTLAESDSIRLLNLKYNKLKINIESKLNELSVIAEKVGIGNNEAVKKIERVKKVIISEEINDEIKREIQTFLVEDEELEKKIIALDEIKEKLKKAKEKLKKESKNIDSSATI